MKRKLLIIVGILLLLILTWMGVSFAIYKLSESVDKDLGNNIKNPSLSIVGNSSLVIDFPEEEMRIENSEQKILVLEGVVKGKNFQLFQTERGSFCIFENEDCYTSVSFENNSNKWKIIGVIRNSNRDLEEDFIIENLDAQDLDPEEFRTQYLSKLNEIIKSHE